MSDIDEIKSKLDIVAYIGKYVVLKKAGRNYKGLCPFHNERTPSFFVSADRQTFHCFGCAKGGTVFDFVMQYEHVTFGEALETLADLAGVQLTNKRQDPHDSIKDKLYEVNHRAAEYYRYILTSHKIGEIGRKYLSDRGLSDKVRDAFSLGYSANSWDGLTKYMKQKGIEEDLLEKSGLAIRGSYGLYDRFRGRLMFPIRDAQKRVVGFAGRVLDADAKEAKYINTPETLLYIKSKLLYGLDQTKDSIVKEGCVVVMEGEFDMLSSYQAGISHVVAIKGSALTEGHVRLLKRYCDRMILALDADFAGDAAARRGIGIADAAGFDIRVAVLPEGQDPDDIARSTPWVLKEALEHAVSVYDYFLSSLLKRYDPNSPYGKKQISDEFLKIVLGIENSIVQGHFVKKLSTLLQVSEDSVMQTLKKLEKQPQTIKSSPQEAPVEVLSGTADEQIDIVVLAYILQGQTMDLIDDIDNESFYTQIQHPAVRQIVEHLGEYKSQPSSFFLQDFLQRLSPEIQQIADTALLWDISSLLEDPDAFYKSWLKVLRRLEYLYVQRQLLLKQTELRQAENSDNSNVTSIQHEVKELSAKRKELENAG